MERVIKLILFYVEFNNGDSNCYQGVRAPTIDEARAFCKDHIDSNPEWEDVAFVSEIDRAQAEKFWDLSCHEDSDWPVFKPEAYLKNDKSERPFAYICSPLRGDIEANMERAREYSRQVFEAGYNPVCPQIFYTQFLQDDISEERAAGMDMGMAMLPMCRAVIICGDNITEGMKREIIRAQELGIEVTTLANIPAIPTLSNYRNDLTGLENLEIAKSLIEGMTGCRFTAGVGGVFIYPDDNAYLAVNMKNKWDYKSGLCRVTFDANIRTMGHPMSADGVLKLQQEIGRTQILLSLLESREFTLSQPEMEELYNSIRKRETGIAADNPVHDGDKTSVLKQIAAARAVSAESSVKQDKPRKSRADER